ncbi:MAG: M48 family metallopeptidase [Wolinella sp.]
MHEESPALCLKARYFDGTSSRERQVRLMLLEHGCIRVQGDECDFVLGRGEFSVHTNAQGASKILLNDGREILLEAEARKTLNTWYHPTLAGFLEGRWRYALLSLLLSALFLMFGYFYGLPYLAHVAARAIPDYVSEKIDQKSAEFLDQLYFSASKLPLERQRRISEAMERFCHANECAPYALLFRSSILGANAFALAKRSIVLTDELVLKSANDEEVIAVLAHEMGHLKHRHMLAQMIKGIGTTLVVYAFIGDVGGVSDMIASAGVLILESGYSRDAEREADQYALHSLTRAGITPKRFADILLRLTEESEGKDLAIFRTHPETKERIKIFLEVK